MTISLYLDPGASNLFESENRPNLKLKLRGVYFMAWIDKVQIKWDKAKL